MQKKVIALSVLLIVSALVLVSFVSANGLSDYRFNVVKTTACISSGNYVVMELANYNNSHGSFNQSGAYNPQIYNYSLCAYFNLNSGSGALSSLACTQGVYNSVYGSPIPRNKIVSLDSLSGSTTQTTNAHGEATYESYYSVPVCYYGIQCITINSTNPSYPNCPINQQNAGNDYPIPALSLVNQTNSHMGNFSDYPNKVCCQVVGLNTQCKLTGMTIQYTKAMVGDQIGINVTGTNCGGAFVMFNLTHNGKAVSVNNEPGWAEFASTSNSNLVMSSWIAGLYDNSKPYNLYNITAEYKIGNQIYSEVSSTRAQTINVTQKPVTFCNSIKTCNDYTTEQNCNSDPTLCNVGPNEFTNNGGVTPYSYGCQWNVTNKTCGFQKVYVGSKEPICGNGYTLCQNPNNSIQYCYPGGVCPTGGIPPSNGDGVCDSTNNIGEGCTSFDCSSGDQANCAKGGVNNKEGDLCENNMCTNITGADFSTMTFPHSNTYPDNNTLCQNDYTQCVGGYDNLNLTYCFPGSVCPNGDQPTASSCASSSWTDSGIKVNPTCADSGACYKNSTGGGYCTVKGAAVGKCNYNFLNTSNTCVNGFLTYKWTASWIGNENKPSTCKDGSSVLECPSQIQLSFFTPYNIIATIVVLVLIYAAIIFVRKKKSTTRHVSSRNSRSSKKTPERKRRSSRKTGKRKR